MDFRLPMLVDLEGVEMKNFKGEMKEDSGNRKGGEEGVRSFDHSHNDDI